MQAARVVAAVALALLGPAAAVADAGPVIVDARERHPLSGPLLAGDAVAYMERGGSYIRLRLVSRERRSATPLMTGELAAPDGRPSDRRIVSGTLDASERVLGLTVTTTFDTTAPSSPPARSVRTYAGAPGTPLGPLSPPCRADAGTPPLGVDGARAVTVGPDCGQLSVLDTVTGERRLLPVPAGHGEVRIAGRYAAWLERATSRYDASAVAVVVDDAGREVLRAAAPMRLNTSPRLELDDQGTIAMYGTIPGRERPEVVTATRADPVLRTVPIAPGTLVRGARLAAGRLALLRTRPGQNLLTGSEVVLTSPRGEDPRTVLRAVDGSFSNAVDFDGRQVAAMARGCRRVLSVRLPADGPPGRAPVGTRCRLQLAAPLEVTRRGLAVRISCEGFTPFCEASRVRLRLGGPRGRLIARSGGGLWPLNRAFTLRLSRAVRRRLRGKRVTLTADVSDLYSAPFAAPPRSVTARVVP